MSTPKRLKFSDCGVGGDSDTSLQKHAVAEEEDPVKKKKKTKKKKKKKRLGSPVIKRIWNEEEELTILKGLVDYRVKTRLDSNFDWDDFFDFVRSSVHVSFSKEQLFSKIRKLRRKFNDNMERINQGKDPLFTRSTDSQAFGYSNMIWGQNEAEAADGTSMENAQAANGSMEKDEAADGRSMENAEAGNGRSMENAEAANGRSMEKDEVANGSMEKAEAANGTSMENAEFANGTSMEQPEVANGRSTEKAEVANGTSMEKAEVANGRSMEKAKFANGSVEKEMQIENDEDSFEENEQVGNEEHVNGNRAKKKRQVDGKSMHGVGVHKTTEYMTDGKEIHQDDDDDLCVVQDAFETMVLQGLSGYQKKLQLEKLRNLGTGKRKELSNEWKALCAEEVELNIKKLRFSVKLVEAANGVVV